MQFPVLPVPKQVSFTSINGVEKLTLENPTAIKFAVKIRTNHKTALHIVPTHEFLEPKSKKDVIVKLLELAQGVKLEINYTPATEEMIAKNDSKMTNVDKKNIKKEITVINVSGVKDVPVGMTGSTGTSSEMVRSKESGHSDDLNSSFMTVIPNKTDHTKSLQKKLSLNLPKQSSSSMIVVEQRLEQDEQEYEEKSKKMRADLSGLQAKILAKRENIFRKKEELSQAADSSSFIPPFAIPIVIIVAYLLGHVIKSFLF